MTTKADFTEQEWELVREGPATAGMVALTASAGGSLRETWAFAKSFAEARQERGGDNELVDAIASEKPLVKKYDSPTEVEEKGLARLSEAVTLLEQKATRGEVEGYKHFALDVAGRIAKAHKESGSVEGVSPEEREAIEKIAASLNPTPPSE
jgi:hypothetical protein